MATNIPASTTGSLVWRLSTRWRASVDRAVAAHGLTHATYVVLSSLYASTRSGDPPQQRELAATTGLEPAYISKLVASLERDGLVRRVTDAADTRAWRLTLTRSGRTRVERAMATVQELHRELLAPLGGPGSAASRRFKADLELLLDTPIPPPGGLR